jgi:hypothetical protein
MPLVLQRPTAFKITVPSELWVLKHNLNRTVGVDAFVLNENNVLEKVLPSEVIKIDDNTVHIVWPTGWLMVGEATVA